MSIVSFVLDTLTGSPKCARQEIRAERKAQTEGLICAVLTGLVILLAVCLLHAAYWGGYLDHLK